MENKRFKIKLTGRAGLLYIEDNHQMVVDTEMLAGDELGIVINKTSIKNWQHPYDNENLTEEKRHTILVNIVTDFERRGYKAYVSPSY